LDPGVYERQLPKSDLQLDDFAEFPRFFDVKQGVVDDMIADFDGLANDFGDEVDCDVFTHATHRRKKIMARGEASAGGVVELLLYAEGTAPEAVPH
jgi:hypothetical protein